MDSERQILLVAIRHHHTGDLISAEREYCEYLRLFPSSAEGFFYLGTLLHESKRFTEAIAALSHSVAIAPGSAAARNNLATSLRAVNELAAALNHLQEAVRIDPGMADAHSNLGGLLHELGDFAGAQTSLETALRLNSKFTQARGSLGLSYLLQGRLREGWHLYEERLLLKERYKSEPFQFPQWDGRPLNNEFVLVRCEQGFGDTIQFIRYAPMVAARGGVVVAGATPELKRVLASAPGVSHVLAPGDPLPPCVAQCYLMSLPRLFDTVLETIPAPRQYLFAGHEAVQYWGGRLQNQKQNRKGIGLVWAGAPHNKHDKRRSISLASWRWLSNVPNAQLFSLQKGPAAGQLIESGLPIIDWTRELHDFAETAALISNLDLVITVDTAVAHLAGALGKPVWVLIHYSPDWRWLLDRSDSPWYPSMRLFRQPTPGDWDTAISGIEQALREFVLARSDNPA